jgi:hypothetical protein
MPVFCRYYFEIMNMCQMQKEIVEMKGENTTWQHTLKT